MTENTEKLDKFDRRILEVLQDDADIPVAELAERVGLTTSPCWRRVQRLEERGVIRKRVALLDPGRLDLAIRHTQSTGAEWCAVKENHPGVRRRDPLQFQGARPGSG